MARAAISCRPRPVSRTRTARPILGDGPALDQAERLQPVARCPVTLPAVTSSSRVSSREVIPSGRRWSWASTSNWGSVRASGTRRRSSRSTQPVGLQQPHPHRDGAPRSGSRSGGRRSQERRRLDLDLGLVVEQRLHLDEGHGRVVPAHALRARPRRAPGARRGTRPCRSRTRPCARAESGFRPPPHTTSSTLSRACANWPTKSAETMRPSRSQPTWPATNSSSPAPFMPWL